VSDRSYAPFPSTLWTQILQAQQGTPETRHAALDRLFHAYWRPVYASIRYGWNKKPEEAKDLTQDFIMLLLEQEFWKAVDPAQGRFRGYLKTALKHFLINETRDQARLKRGGGKSIISLDQIEEFTRPSYQGRTPEEILDEEWVRTVLVRALEKIQEEFTKSKKEKHAEILRLYYFADPDREPPTYSEIAASLGLTEANVGYYLHEIRSQLRKRVEEIILEYAVDDGDMREETRFILG